MRNQPPPMAEVLDLFESDPSSPAPRLFDIAMWIAEAAEKNGVGPATAGRIAALSVRRILDEFERLS
jgi:ApbE superfamily uncharacterized protein (UPF0280 family)